jgi:hypothetical protein
MTPLGAREMAVKCKFRSQSRTALFAAFGPQEEGRHDG